jgi:osmotically-inducible protein OsmY
MNEQVSDQPEYLIGRIQQALATDPRTGELELDVRIAGGRIFLTGAVATDERRAAVEEVVREIAPGQDVANELTVTVETEPGPEEPLP